MPELPLAQVVLEGRDSELAEPPPMAKFQWSCDACGHQWVDEGIFQVAAGGQSWPGEEFSSRRGPFRRVDPKLTSSPRRSRIISPYEESHQQEQWHQLTDTYRHMTEEELCRVAADAFDLVPFAKEALQAVIAERGLKIELAAAPAPPPALELSHYEDDQKVPYRLVCVRTVRSESEARQLKALLDANYFASCLGPENIVDLKDFKGSFDGGVELKVHAFNSRRAFDALRLLAPEEEGPDAEPDDAIRSTAVLCPKCHCQEVFLREDGPEAAAADAEGKFKWQCDACGHQWENEGIEEKL